MIRCVASFHDQQYKTHLHDFLHAFESLEDNGTLKHPLVLVELSQPLTKAQIRAKKRKANQEDRLQQELQRLNWFLSQGYVLVYTDGSSKRYDLVGWVGGFGIFVAPPPPFGSLCPAYPEGVPTDQQWCRTVCCVPCAD